MTAKNNAQLIETITLLMLVNTQCLQCGALSIDLMIDQVNASINQSIYQKLFQKVFS